MIKMMGAILIIAGTAAWGVGSIARLRGRARSLNAVVSSLYVMENEICGRLLPMPELLELLSDEAADPASELFRNAQKKMSELGGRQFSEIWREAIRCTPQLFLTAQEELCLSELGFSLGRYDVGEQKAALGYTIRRMSEFAARAEQERDSNSKLHAFLGVAAGIFAVVVLV